MSTSRLQLVFLGRLVEGDFADDPQGVLWHEPDQDELRRLQSALRRNGARGAEFVAPSDDAWHDTVPVPVPVPEEEAAPLLNTRPESATPTLPFPVLMACEETPLPAASVPAPPLEKSFGRAQTSAAAPPPATDAPSRLVVFCPNCGERQTMRVLCRGCASFLEVAMKAKAERYEQARSKARSGGLLALFGA